MENFSMPLLIIVCEPDSALQKFCKLFDRILPEKKIIVQALGNTEMNKLTLL